MTSLNRLYLNDDYDMYNGMTFKANHTLFEVKFVEENCNEIVLGAH